MFELYELQEVPPEPLLYEQVVRPLLNERQFSGALAPTCDPRGSAKLMIPMAPAISAFRVALILLFIVLLLLVRRLL